MVKSSLIENECHIRRGKSKQGDEISIKELTWRAINNNKNIKRNEECL